MNRIVSLLVAAALAAPEVAIAQNASINSPGGTTSAIGSSGGIAPGLATITGPMTGPPVIGGPGVGIAPTGTPPTIGATAMGEGMAPPNAMPGTPGAIVGTSLRPKDGTFVAGANSFTVGQARGRLQRSGYAQVSGLHRDSHGIWRGKAVKDGQPVDVSLDYQGKVVGQ